MTAQAFANGMNDVAATFSHFTYCESKGAMMIVDIQGWDRLNFRNFSNDEAVFFTDPQIHTRSYRGCSKHGRDEELFRRFSVGNFGYAGMVRFFHTHHCSVNCDYFGLGHPMQCEDRFSWARAPTVEEHACEGHGED